MSKIVYKKCNICLEVMSDEFFHKHKKNSDGLTGYCKTCASVRNVLKSKFGIVKTAVVRQLVELIDQNKTVEAMKLIKDSRSV